MLAASVVLALIAAWAFATSTLLQQSRARSLALDDPGTPATRRDWLPVLGVISRIVRDPVWLLGLVANVVGFGLHAVALNLGPIAVVQSVLVVQLLLALAIGSARRRLRPQRRDFLAAGAICAGVIMLVFERSGAGRREAPQGHVLAFFAVAAVLIVGLLAVARSGPEGAPWRGAVVGLAAGTSFCSTAVLMTLISHRLDDSGVSGLLGWPTAGLVVLGVTGTVLVQDAFSSGPLPGPLTAMTVADPVLSAIAGAVLFDADRPSPLQLAVGLPAAGLLIAVGVALLARSQSLWLEQDQAATASPASDEWSARNLRTVSDHG